MPDTKPRKGEFGEPFRVAWGAINDPSRTVYRDDYTYVARFTRREDAELFVARANAQDGCVPERLLDLIGDSHRVLVALLAPEPGGADLRFQAYKHLKATLRAFAPFMFEEEVT